MCAFFLPAGYLLLLIRRYGVDVPFLEQWNVAMLFEKLSRGTLTLADLFAQQNEYRQFFPHLLIVGAGSLTGWNVRGDLYLVFVLACLVALSIYRLGALTLAGAGELKRAAAFCLTCLLVFTPMQYENWLYGIQVVYLLPVACVVAGVLVAQTETRPRTKVVVCGGLAVIASFSAANGMLSWPVLLPLLLLEPRATWQERRWLIVGWSMCAAACAAIYLHGWQPTPEHPSMLEALRQPARALLFYFSFLGTPLWAGSHALTVGVGLTLFIAYALSLVFLWRNRGDCALVRRMSGWLMLGAFSLLSGALVTLGRVGFGMRQAEAPRYIAFSLYLPAALAHLLPLLSAELKRRGHSERARVVSAAAAIALVLALAAQARLYPIGTLSMMYKWREHAHEKACTLFVNVLPDECPTAHMLRGDMLRRGANALDRIGYLRPGLIRGARLEEIEAQTAEPPGVFAGLREETDGAFVATGVARLPIGGRPADAVLLAYERGAGESIIFAISKAPTVDEREYSIRRLREVVSPGIGWRVRVAADRLPGGALQISAWAFDAEEGKAYKLSGSHIARERR